MVEIIFSKEAFKTYAGFLTNVSAAWFISVFLSNSFLELTWRTVATILALYLAIVLERIGK